jgi:hypothetical protein
MWYWLASTDSKRRPVGALIKLVGTDSALQSLSDFARSEGGSEQKLTRRGEFDRGWGRGQRGRDERAVNS